MDVLLTRHRSLQVSSGGSQPEEEKEVNRSKFPSFNILLRSVFLKPLASDPTSLLVNMTKTNEE